MALTLVSTPGAANANSYEEVTDADAYFEARVALDPAWDEADSKEALLVMATRVIDAAFRGQRTLVPGKDSYYRIGRKWLGATASSTQRLAWPRIGLYHDNGAAIAADEIPWELKEAVAEMAGQLGGTDRTLDNDVAVQGITSVKAGSVAVTFRDGAILAQTLPQAVVDLIPPSWYTEEVDELTQQADFAVVL